MKQIFENINTVLADWDPIGVDKSVALSEYTQYVPKILSYIADKQQLMNYLEDLLVNHIGLGYNPSNKEHVQDLEDVCERLMKTYRLSKQFKLENEKEASEAIKRIIVKYYPNGIIKHDVSDNIQVTEIGEVLSILRRHNSLSKIRKELFNILSISFGQESNKSTLNDISQDLYKEVKLKYFR